MGSFIHRGADGDDVNDSGLLGAGLGAEGSPYSVNASPTSKKGGKTSAHGVGGAGVGITGTSQYD